MKKLILNCSLFVALALTANNSFAQYSPYGVKMFEQGFQIDQIDNYELYASGFSIFTMNVDRNASGTITDMDATWNTLFGNKQNLTTSAFSGNLSFYNNQIIDANNDINTFTTDTREIFESDGSNDTTITEVAYDPTTSAIIYIRKYAFTYNTNGSINTIHQYYRPDSASSFSLQQIDNYYYNSNNMIDSIITTDGSATFERSIYYTTGSIIDSIYFYGSDLGPIQLMQIGRFSYSNGSTILSLFSDGDQNGSFTFEARWTFNLETNGISENSQKSWSAYPNPCADQLSIESAKSEAFEIYTADGKLVDKATLKVGVNQIDLSQFPSGFYYIKTSQQVEKILLNR